MLLDKTSQYASQFMPMELKRVILKIRILARLKAGDTYSYAIIKEFDKSGFCDFFGPTIKNDTYNALKVLEKSGYIRMHIKLHGGRAQKFYKITKSGSAALKSVGRMMVSTMKEANKLFE